MTDPTKLAMELADVQIVPQHEYLKRELNWRFDDLMRELCKSKGKWTVAAIEARQALRQAEAAYAAARKPAK